MAVALAGTHLHLGGLGIRNFVPKIMMDTRTPSLMISSDDFLALPLEKEYFDQLKHVTKKSTWLVYKPAEIEKLRDFVCDYFQGSSTGEDGVWANLESTVLSTSNDSGATWLPTSESASAWAGIRTKESVRPLIVEETVDPQSTGTVPLQMYLRLPVGVKNGSGVSGVLAYCTWVHDRNEIEQGLLIDPNRIGRDQRDPALQMVRYANEHNLALLTWATPGEWNVQVSNQDLSYSARSTESRLFDDYARAWDEGVTHLVDKTNIPSSGFLLYGVSRGGQWAHRLALRKPQRFFAINIHISTSYDLPTADGANCLWLVTTGEKESGYKRTLDFYDQCRQLGYPIIFKAEENLAHDSCIEVEKLRDNFFDYALELEKAQTDKSIDTSALAAQVGQSWVSSQFIGDIINQDVLDRTDAQDLPASQLVHLPNQEISRAWAALHIPDKN